MLLNLVLIVSELTIFSTATEYCIVGAGPGGLQIGYFLERANHDYVVFERNNVAASFYTKYPVHRELISINKKYTGSENKETQFRQDWNSLIDEGFNKFTDYTDIYFPPTDKLLEYMHDYAEHHKLNIHYNTNVKRVTSTPLPDCKYALITEKSNVSGKTCCQNIVVATGVNVEHLPNMKGSELITPYGEISRWGFDYKNQNILIIGLGNSAFETAKEMYRYGAHVHLVGRGPVKLSWETHYVGDIRGINNEVLDSYMLKSLDGIVYLDSDQGGVLSLGGARKLEDFKIIRGKDNKLYFKSDVGEGEIDNNVGRFGYDIVIAASGFKWDPSIFNSTVTQASAMKSILGKPLPGGKYPAIRPNFESDVNENIFFAGTMTHSLDFRKSAGGFIHGFRYSARVLFNLLQWRNHNIKWPNTIAGVQQLAAHLLKRINESSGLYQMFAYLADIVVIHRDTQTYTYLEEFPVPLLPELTKHTGIEFGSQDQLLVSVFQYGANFSKDGGWDTLGLASGISNINIAHLCNFLHPVMYYYSKLPTAQNFEETKQLMPNEFMPKPTDRHHVLEDFNFLWESSEAYLLPVRKFLESNMNVELREYSPATCISVLLASNYKSLSNGAVPLSCLEYMAAQ